MSRIYIFRGVAHTYIHTREKNRTKQKRKHYKRLPQGLPGPLQGAAHAPRPRGHRLAGRAGLAAGTGGGWGAARAGQEVCFVCFVCSRGEWFKINVDTHPVCFLLVYPSSSHATSYSFETSRHKLSTNEIASLTTDHVPTWTPREDLASLGRLILTLACPSLGPAPSLDLMATSGRYSPQLVQLVSALLRSGAGGSIDSAEHLLCSIGDRVARELETAEQVSWLQCSDRRADREDVCLLIIGHWAFKDTNKQCMCRYNQLDRIYRRRKIERTCTYNHDK